MEDELYKFIKEEIRPVVSEATIAQAWSRDRINRAKAVLKRIDEEL